MLKKIKSYMCIYVYAYMCMHICAYIFILIFGRLHKIKVGRTEGSR